MTCKKWPELGIQVSGTIFDAAVIGFKWGKTFWLSRHEANFGVEYFVFCFDSIIQSLDATHFLKAETNSIMSLKGFGNWGFFSKCTSQSGCLKIENFKDWWVGYLGYLRHTSYLSQTPQTCLCKKFLSGVNFSRLSEKNAYIWLFQRYF